MRRRRGVAAGSVLVGGAAVASLLSGAVSGATASALEPHTGSVSVTVDSDAGTVAGGSAGSTRYGTGSETLADAIAFVDAQGGGTITFASGLSGTIALSAALPEITQPTTITGPGASALTIDGGGEAGGLGSIFTIYTSSGTAEISGLTLTNGYAPNGGAVWDRSTPLTLSDDLFTNDSVSAGLGGAAYVKSTGLTITDSTFSYDDGVDSGTSGGAVDVYGGPLVITGSTFAHDQAGSSGGAVYANAGSAMISGSTFANDAATHGGGAIDDGDGSGGTLGIYDSTLTANTAGAVGGMGGGAIEAENLNTTIADSTITGNYADDFGGGIWLTNFGGGEGSLTLHDSILAGNTYTGGGEQDIYLADSMDVSSNFSLVGDPSGTPITASGQNLVGTHADPLNPKLGPLQNNGGPTQTMLPQLNSLVLDAGNAFELTTDQRGEPRTVDLSLANPAGGDGTDIGAIERQPSELPDRSLRGTLGTRRVTMTLPSTLLCPKPSGRLAVRFTSVAPTGSSVSAKLRFKDAELRIDRGVKHVHTVTRLVRGHRKKVKVTSYLPNAVVHGSSGSASLKLSGLAVGAHSLRLAFVFTETEHRHVHHRTVKVTKTVTKALGSKFSTC